MLLPDDATTVSNLIWSPELRLEVWSKSNRAIKKDVDWLTVIVLPDWPRLVLVPLAKVTILLSIAELALARMLIRLPSIGCWYAMCLR
jgi:hypothetical protein